MSTPNWHKSSFSDAGGNNCIEIAIDSVGIAVRESFEPDTIVTTDRITLRDFIRGVKGGRLDHLLD
ncbi:DUF397 domain-containing protein [Streptomyces antimycoticus]|uniref:DUF397 domain-containing protein n=1 Tax=Streptomyces antimycoticus TaxID=68175 RepID=UPI0034408F36